MEISLADLIQAVRNDDPPISFTCPWECGKPYLIRTVTMIICGTLVFVGPHELKLENAAWIADTGRFFDTLKDPECVNEAEPFVNPVIVGRGAIVDATIWHKWTPTQK